MRSRIKNWIIRVVFWGFIIALIFGGLISKNVIASTAAHHGNGFLLLGNATLRLLKDIGGLFTPLWHSFWHWVNKGGVTVKVHHR